MELIFGNYQLLEFGSHLCAWSWLTYIREKSLVLGFILVTLVVSYLTYFRQLSVIEKLGNDVWANLKCFLVYFAWFFGVL